MPGIEEIRRAFPMPSKLVARRRMTSKEISQLSRDYMVNPGYSTPSSSSDLSVVPKAIWNALTPRTNEPEGAPLAGGDDPRSLGGWLNYFKGEAQAYDPRSLEGAANIAGLLGGPRRTSELGTPNMGFGHAEKEFPSLIPNVTMKRLKEGDTTLGISGGRARYYHPSPRARGEELGGTRRGTVRGKAVPVGYAWVRDDTGEVIAAIDMEIGKDSNHVSAIVQKPEYRGGEKAKQMYTPYFMLDVDRLMHGVGKPVEANVVNTDLARSLAMIGRINPLFAFFTENYAHLLGTKRNRGSKIEREEMGDFDPTEYGMVEDPNEPGTFVPPEHPGDPLSWRQEPRQNRLTNREDVAFELAHLLRRQYPHEVAEIGRSFPGQIGTRIRRYLDLMRGAAGFDEATIRSFEERLPDMFPPRQQEAPSWVGAHNQLRSFLRDQGYENEVASINRSFPLREGQTRPVRDRIRAYMELLANDNYPVETLNHFGRMIPSPPRMIGSQRGTSFAGWASAELAIRRRLRTMRENDVVDHILEQHPFVEDARERRQAAQDRVMSYLDYIERVDPSMAEHLRRRLP